jgi:hypothetical protein
MQSTRYSCHILMKAEFSRQIFEKRLYIKFSENPSSEIGVVPCRQTRTDGQQTDRHTDRHDEANSRFSQFCNTA